MNIFSKSFLLQKLLAVHRQFADHVQDYDGPNNQLVPYISPIYRQYVLC